MKDVEQKVKQKIEEILSPKCNAVKGEKIMAQLEELLIIHAFNSFATEIEKEKQDLIEQIKQLQEENKKLHSQLNRISFTPYPEG